MKRNLGTLAAILFTCHAIACEAGGPSDATEETTAALSTLTWIRIHVIRTANDDGSDPGEVSQGNIDRAINIANDIFGPIRVRFVRHNPIEDRRDTLLNQDCILAPGVTLPSTTKPACDSQVVQNRRNQVANEYPGQIVVYASYGRHIHESGGAWHYVQRGGSFSGPEHPFVALASHGVFRDDTDDEVGDLLAHELGHYFGLQHTHSDEFVGILDKLADKGTAHFEAKKFVQIKVASGVATMENAASLFDGDGLADTPPDPGPFVFSSAGLSVVDATVRSVDLFVDFPWLPAQRTYSFSPQTSNIMGYWNRRERGETPQLSRSQQLLIDYALTFGNRQALLTPWF